MQPARLLKHKSQRIGEQQNQPSKTKEQKRAELEAIEATARLKQRNLTKESQKQTKFIPSEATSSKLPFQQKKSDNIPIFSPALSRASSIHIDQKQELFQKYPKFKEFLKIFEISVKSWIADKKAKKDKNLKNYQKAADIFYEYIDNPSEGAKIDISSLNLEDLPENIEKALLPHVRLRLHDNKFRRLPLDIHLVNDEVRIRLKENLFNDLEDLVIMLLSSYWKKHINIYSENEDTQQISSYKGKETARTSLLTFEYHNAPLLAKKISEVIDYRGKNTAATVQEWEKRDAQLKAGVWDSDEEMNLIFTRNLQYSIQEDNISAMQSHIEKDPKLRRFYDEYLRALKSVFDASSALANIDKRADVQTQLSITQSVATGATTIVAMLAKHSGFPFLTGAGDILKSGLNFYQNHQFDKFHKKVNNFSKFIGFTKEDIDAFCQTIARFITLSEDYHLQKYREKLQQGKVIKNPKGVPSTDKKI